MKGVKRLFITDKQETGIVERRGKRSKRKVDERKKAVEKREKTEKLEEVGLEGDAPLPS